jgi:TolB-like protein/Flp pilus assembly protein TadD
MDREKNLPSPLPEAISMEEVRSQVARILASGAFSNAGRMSRFLSFSVEETLGGRGASLKEYSLGVAVFDRPVDFDPRTEPIVRVEARRLRAKLDTYYRTEGAADDLIVELPKGGYRLEFRHRGDAPAAEPAKPEAIRLAVLPFTSLASGEDDDYFTEGLSEELIHVLTKVPGIEVIAWGSSAKLRGPEDLERASRHLNLSHYFRGSVRRAGSQLKIMAQLLDARDGRYLWSEVFERNVGDLHAIEAEIAGAIAQKFRIGFQSSSVPLALAKSNAEPGSEEHSLYLMGRFHANKRTIEGLESSVRCYEQAIATRPAYAMAHAGLADSLSLLMDYGARNPHETVQRARAAAERATQDTCPTASAAGHASLALLASTYEWKWAEAERLYRRAIASDANYATAHHWLGVDLLLNLGRFDEAEVELNIARRLDPLSAIIAEGMVMHRLLQGQYEEALRECQSVMEIDPNFYMVYASIGRILTMMGRFNEAIENYERARRLRLLLAPKLEGGYGQALALAGRREEARAILSNLIEIGETRHVPATALGVVELGLGDIEAALGHFEAAAENRESSVCMFGIHPLYDSLRHNKRFRALLGRIDLLTVSDSR